MAEARSTPSKKVRSACQRCRIRRIKCDGRVPSCGNCSKAGEPCIDVDIQNQDILIPRKIRWLETIIRERLPDVDLNEGPQIDVSPEKTANVNPQSLGPADEIAASSTSDHDGKIPPDGGVDARQSVKRTHDDMAAASEDQDSLPEGAHMVAVNLGMLSLNSDSSQKHYLGSSSGLLFSKLIGASPSSIEASPEADRNPSLHYTMLGRSGMQNRAAQQRFRTLQQLLNTHLPKKEDAIVLIQTYVRETHPDFPVLDPMGLFAALEALYQCCMSDHDQVYHNDWPHTVSDFRWNGQDIRTSTAAGKAVPPSVIAFILFMIFNIAAIVKVRGGVYDFSPSKFYQAALLFSGDCFSQISISSIQAVVMLIIHSILTPAEVNLWTVIHIAMAQVVELGLHREPQRGSTQDEEGAQIHRFLFYVIYSLDRSISTIQGRPLGFRDETFDINPPMHSGRVTNTADDEIPDFFSVDVIKYSSQVFKLDRIVSDIKVHLYHLPVQSIFPTMADPEAIQKRIETDLEAWWAEVSENKLGLMGLDNRQKQTWNLKLKIRYHTTTLLLFQPSQSIRNPADKSLQKCFDCASSILKTYQLLHDNHCLHFGWRTVQNIFAAGATLIYTFWTSLPVQANTSITDLSRSLRICSSLLSVGGEWWPSVKAGRNSLETVADLTIRKLYSLNIPSKQRRTLARTQPTLQDPSHLNPTLNPATSDRAGEADTLRDATDSGYPADLESFADSRPMADLSHWHTTTEYDIPQSHDEWQIYSSDFENPITSGMGTVPEIETFLADFDNSEFSWNFPLHAVEGQPADIDFFDTSYIE